MAIDIFIIGGGINGVGAAVDAAGRGYNVILCEKGDLGEATSSASSKLIHGGLRYLENYQFALVRKALKERETLWRQAPHIISPLNFVMPLNEDIRPAWLIRLGLFLYDFLGPRKQLAHSKPINLSTHPWGKALNTNFSQGFSFSDCKVDDARLVILNAIAAKEHGAIILPHTEFKSAQRYKKYWKISLYEKKTGRTNVVRARAIINAAGPWVEKCLQQLSDTHIPIRLRLVKGSHIVVPRIYSGDQAYILQHDDQRIIFVIPYESDFSLIGTTEVDFKGDPSNTKISTTEINYLCRLCNDYFGTQLTKKSIIWSYSGVRPLHDHQSINHSTASRDYQLVLDNKNAALLSIVGSKITTYRIAAEESINMLCPYLPKKIKPWTQKLILPGGDIPERDIDKFISTIQANYPWLPANICRHYAKTYGTRVYQLLENTHSLIDLGEFFAAELYQKEVEYLLQTEWAISADDILWRRTKQGLFFSSSDKNKLQNWLMRRASWPIPKK